MKMEDVKGVISTIEALMNGRKMIDAKKTLRELGKELENLERYKEFFDEVKKLVRNQGRSNMISVQEIEDLIIKYNN